MVLYRRADSKAFRGEPRRYEIDVLLDFNKARRGCNGMPEREEYRQHRGRVKRWRKVHKSLIYYRMKRRGPRMEP